MQQIKALSEPMPIAVFHKKLSHEGSWKAGSIHVTFLGDYY